MAKKLRVNWKLHALIAQNSLKLLIVNFTKFFELFEVLVFVALQILNYKKEKRKKPAKIMILTAHRIDIYASNKNNSHNTYDESHNDGWQNIVCATNCLSVDFLYAYWGVMSFFQHQYAHTSTKVRAGWKRCVRSVCHEQIYSCIQLNPLFFLKNFGKNEQSLNVKKVKNGDDLRIGHIC